MPHSETTAPDFVAVGHVTRDLLPGGGWRLGGTVTFAAITAQRLGLRAGIVTSATPEVLEAVARALPGISVVAESSTEATTFENVYEEHGRRQYLRNRAMVLTPDLVPVEWRAAPIILMAPLAAELAPELAPAFAAHLLAATPQGWLRQWDASGAVSPRPMTEEETLTLAHLDALILSREDLGIRVGSPTPVEAARAQIAEWSRSVRLVVVTDGPAGAMLYRDGQAGERFDGYPAREVDPTGAGDVFAAAFLCALHRTGDARMAVDFANQVAACSVEKEGSAGIPTLEGVSLRFRRE